MDITHDLTKALESGDQMLAAKTVKAVQDAIDEQVAAAQESKKAALDAIAVAEGFEAQNSTLAKAVLDLTSVIKNVHLVLGRKTDLLQGDAETLVLMNELATFVLGSGSIKAGVVSHAMEQQ